MTSGRKLRTNEKLMRVVATWIATAALLGVMVQNARPADRLVNRIPVEFLGFWQTKLDQCQSGYEGWLYISDLQIREVGGTGNVVSVSYIAALEIEIDMDWQSNPKGRDDGRKVGRLVLSQDGKKITETRDGNSFSRIRCE
jgi:hypothetical protein